MKKKIWIGVLVAVMVGLLYGYWTEWRFERIKVYNAIQYIDEYEENYYKVKFKLERGWFGSSGVKIIYFLPGQKEKMMSKIKEDVINYLEEIIEKHGDIFYKYEVSDDFKQVLVYETSCDNKHMHNDILDGQISSLVWLYHDIKNDRSSDVGQVVTVIEPDD